MADEIFAQLTGAIWRVVAFPVSSFETSFRQDLVQHTYPDRDGAHLEATGRAPLQHTFKIPFRNNIRPGKNELWAQGQLYPQTWRAFLAACADRSRGILVHPELGKLRCRVESDRTNWDSRTRDGVDVDVSFFEDTEKPEDLKNVLSSGSPITQLESSALAVDTYITALTLAKVAGLQVPAYQYSFSDLVRQVKAVTDVPSIARMQYGSALDRLTFQANGIARSLSAAKDASLWPLSNALERVKASAHDVKRTLGIAPKPTRLYTLPQDMTFAAIAIATGATLRELMSLNAAHLGGPVVPRGTRVRYFADGA
jgi:prophage DNA circulation protein